MKLRYIFYILFFSAKSFAVVDMKNANYSNTWTDIKVNGAGYDLKLERTYNSRTLFNGMFGFGWCSNFETSLDITAEGNLKVKECGAGAEVLFSARELSRKDVDRTVDLIISKMKADKTQPRTEEYYKKAREELVHYDDMRSSLASKMGIKVSIKEGTKFFANGKEVENIIYTKNYYERTLPDGTKQRFSLQGKMTAAYDKNGNVLKLEYEKDLLKEVSDNNGRRLTFKYFPNKKVKEVVGPNGLKTEYKFVNIDDLSYSKDSLGLVNNYDYDDLHNLTKVSFSDKTNIQIKYNQKEDWVIGFTDRDKCVESYTYEVAAKDPGHFWSTAKKVCGKETTADNRYEFWHQQSPNGDYNLQRVLTKEGGNTIDITYHETFGRPVSIRRNSERVTYDYFPNGLVKLKASALAKMLFEYENEFKKVSKVTIEAFNEKGKLLSTKLTNFQYDKKSNLIFASNTDGQKINITYDNRGRIATITDQAKKVVKIEYEERHGKPTLVTRPGLGTIKVSYKPTGEISEVKSPEGPTVATQVASTFNNLLDIIAPATAELYL